MVTFLESCADPTTCQGLVVDYSGDFRTLLWVQGSNCAPLIPPAGTCCNLEAVLSWLHFSSFILHTAGDWRRSWSIQSTEGVSFNTQSYLSNGSTRRKWLLFNSTQASFQIVWSEQLVLRFAIFHVKIREFDDWKLMLFTRLNCGLINVIFTS